MVRRTRRPLGLLRVRVGRDVRPGDRLQRRPQLGAVPLDGEHVVAARVGDQRRGVVLGVHGVDGQDGPSQVQDGQKRSHGGDFVGLGRDRQLPEDDPGGVVERRDQMRCGRAAGASAADGLAVDRDHPLAPDQSGRGPHPGSDQPVQHLWVQPGEQAPEHRLVRCAAPGVQAERDRRGLVLVSQPGRDRRERRGPRQRGRDPGRHDPDQGIPPTPPAARIDHSGQYRQQRRCPNWAGQGRDDERGRRGRG